MPTTSVASQLSSISIDIANSSQIFSSPSTTSLKQQRQTPAFIHLNQQSNSHENTTTTNHHHPQPSTCSTQSSSCPPWLPPAVSPPHKLPRWPTPSSSDSQAQTSSPTPPTALKRACAMSSYHSTSSLPPTLSSSILMAMTVAGDPSTEIEPNMSAMPNWQLKMRSL